MRAREAGDLDAGDLEAGDLDAGDLDAGDLDALDLSVVLPARDEAAAIDGVLDELQAALAATGLRWEVLVVDDGSRDDTAARAAARGATVLVRPAPAGAGAAIKTGVLAARGEAIAYLD